MKFSAYVVACIARSAVVCTVWAYTPGRGYYQLQVFVNTKSPAPDKIERPRHFALSKAVKVMRQGDRNCSRYHKVGGVTKRGRWWLESGEVLTVYVSDGRSVSLSPLYRLP
ncbi:hypothetical protein ElyMa_006282000 [Elysia marginata]|uniref:Uncharacterized protein n=1 Tax=Elysia marginata TaxID=1093978 RepID=A0AAV4HCZ5_9GAST|nr:hypothetical protein ElyMa_006282000 [Elysia marginata]